MKNIRGPRGGREEKGWGGGNARECMELTHAACILMAADPGLSPGGAVADICQVYSHVREIRER